MFAYMGDWMKDNLSADTPFFVGAISKSNASFNASGT